MSPWKVLLPSTENHFALLKDEDENDTEKVLNPAYRITSWSQSMEIGNAKEFSWKDEGEEEEE